MSILGTIKRAFGFDSDDPELEEETGQEDVPAGLPPTPSYSDESKAVTTVLTEARAAITEQEMQEAESQEAVPELSQEAVDALLNDKSLPADIFDDIITIFNGALPDFVEKCIDPELQRRNLLDALDAKIRKRLARELAQARRKGRRELADERAKLESELTKVKDLNRILDERQRDTNAARLSAERQKRALNDRVHDLESQVEKLEAEKEQYALETKSMLSRMRAASVAAHDECHPAVSPDDKAQLAEAGKKLAEAESRLKEISADNAKLHEALEQQKAQKKLGDAMISSLQSSASKAEKEAERLRQELEATTTSAAEQEQTLTTIENLRQNIADKEATISELKEECDSSKAKVDELTETLRDNLRKYSFEEARLRRQIEKLEKALNEAVSPPPTVTFDTDDTPSPAIAEPVPDTSEPEAELPAGNEPEAEPSTQTTPRKRRGRKPKASPRINAIDEYIEGNEWFGTSEPESKAAKSAASTDDDDFGYKHPQRHNQPANEDQLSLW